MIDIGPWRFTNDDARRTLEVLDEVVNHAAWQRPEGIFEAAMATARQIQRHDHEPLEHRLRGGWHLMSGLRDVLAHHALLPSAQPGEVVGLFVSNGGVPKHTVAQTTVTHAGVVGDRQATRRHHGRPWQALCLWSSEVVAHLRSQGHPITPGAAGENVSLNGFDWSDIRPGVRLRLGEVLCEVSTYSIPCTKNAQWFTDGRFSTIHHAQGPVSRVYATVLEPGSIVLGDVATVEPRMPGTLRHTPGLS
jgi:MOSC domain-containing protein YiiM